MQITWKRATNAPGCAGLIVAEDGREVLVQTDWDYPSVAQAFGWNMRDVQVMNAHYYGVPCSHPETDGTVPCSECGLTQSTFIREAGDWLRDNYGAMAEDPGYFA